jgi:hypothetical protein
MLNHTQVYKCKGSSVASEFEINCCGELGQCSPILPNGMGTSEKGKVFIIPQLNPKLSAVEFKLVVNFLAFLGFLPTQP